MDLHVVPVLLGRGQRLFDHLPADHIELELTRRLSARDVDPAHQARALYDPATRQQLHRPMAGLPAPEREPCPVSG